MFSLAPIVLLSDFGLSDPYSGIVKGVISRISPETNVIDLTHRIHPQNIRQASFVLANSYSYFPDNSIFMCVVDPGVGSQRKIIAAKSGNKYFLAPDNGLLSATLSVLEDLTIYQVDNKSLYLPKVSSTFHARDIFAPIAAKLSKGLDPSGLGPILSIDDIITSPPIQNVKLFENTYKAESVFKDVFGNLVTSASLEFLKSVGLEDKNIKIKIGNIIIKGLSQSYADVEQGEPLAYIGSYGYLELGVRNGSFFRYCNSENPDIIITLE